MTIPTWTMSVQKVTGLVNKYVYQMVKKYTTANKYYLSINGKVLSCIARINY